MRTLIRLSIHSCFLLLGLLLCNVPELESFVLPPVVTSFRRQDETAMKEKILRPQAPLAQHKRCLIHNDEHANKSTRISTILQASTTTNHATQATSSSSPRGPVLLQKILRPTVAGELEFLGSLVAWLQDAWELPSNMPMVYEKQLDDENDSSSSVLVWNSPLSPSAAATTLYVDVVAVYPDKSGDTTNNNNVVMAMVVLRKAAEAPQAWSTDLPPMLQNLFADAEKRIVRDLDQTLLEWQKEQSSSSSSSRRPKTEATQVEKFHQAKRDMMAELLEEMTPAQRQQQEKSEAVKEKNADNTILDAEIVLDSPPEQDKQDDDTMEESNTGTQSLSALAMDNIASAANGTTSTKRLKRDDKTLDDFAVRAAQRVAQQQQTEDFAVQAARRVARQKDWQAPTSKQSAKEQRTEPSPATFDSETDTTARQPTVSSVPLEQEQPMQIDPRAVRPPMLSQAVSGSRAFSRSISRPDQYAAKRQSRPKARVKTGNQQETSITAKETNQKAKVSSPARPQLTKQSPGSDQQTTKSISKAIDARVDKSTKDATDHKSKTSKQSLPAVDDVKENPKTVPDTKNRKVNIVTEEKMDPSQEEQVRLANDALNEVVASTEDMSPEEMLNAVMQFGDEQKKEETVGQGFVSGAFEKAKELLKEQHRKREERLRQNVATKVVQDFPSIRPNIKFDDTEQEEASEPLSAEEEMRRMFAAGEKLADSRITVVQPESSGGDLAQPTPDEEKLIDELVASNKEVSSYARVLDDELVELEMRINKSPGEKEDRKGPNPVFDIFSGPELYNPNVDPETAVNWPGAMPDTKTNLRLPKELDEAVKQARFAASVLSKMEEKEEDGTKVYFAGERQLTEEQVTQMRAVVKEASELGIISDPLEIMAERSRLQMIVDELWHQPEERFRDIISEYKDLLLSDHFVGLVKERLSDMADRDIDALRRDDSSLEEHHEREREILGGLVAYAQLLLKEARALGAELEAQQLEVIRSICKVAMDPSLKTEEETATALSDAVRDMRPLFDDAFVAYLKYAVAEEEARLARAGTLDDPDHAQWLYVLKIVQQGVYKEISRGISRYIDHLWYILRMETAKERRMLLSKIIDVLPTLDVRPFVQVIDNIAGALGDSARGEFDGGVPLGEMTNKILQLRRDVQELLPPERIAVMSRDADEWSKRRKAKLLEQRNLTKQRLKAARETEHLEDEINSLGRRGETERFD